MIISLILEAKKKKEKKLNKENQDVDKKKILKKDDSNEDISELKKEKPSKSKKTKKDKKEDKTKTTKKKKRNQTIDGIKAVNKKRIEDKQNNPFKIKFLKIIPIYSVGLFVIIFLYILIQLGLLLGGKTYYIEGTFELTKDNNVVFIPEFSKINKREVNIDFLNKDKIYYSYDKNSEKWYYTEKKGDITLNIIDIDDYYVYLDGENLDGLIFDIEKLELTGYSIGKKTKAPFKNVFGTYKLYFSFMEKMNVFDDLYKVK